MATNARPRRPWEEGSEVSKPASNAHNSSVTSVETSLPQLNSEGYHKPANAYGLPNKLPSEQHAGIGLANWSQPLHHGPLHHGPSDGRNEAFARSKRRRTEDYVLSRSTDSTDFAHRERRIESSAGTSTRVEPSPAIHDICCAPGCPGPQCSSIRKTAAGINEDLAVHELLVHGSRSEEKHDVAVDAIDTPLTLLLLAIRSRLRESNASLQSLLDSNLAKKTGQVSSSSQPQQHSTSSNADLLGTKQSPSLLPSARSRLQVSEPRPGSPESAYVVPNTRPAGLPSAMSSSASTCTSNASAIAATSTPVPSTSFAQNEVLNDLSHQLSVKTLSHTALSREYDMLLQKLSRQRVKCAALERKFEVSDAEIVSLSTDKERLEDRVESLEQQAKELQKQRDEARRASEDSKGQWMRIVEMAGKLHGGKETANPIGGSSAEKNWAEERASLLKRIDQMETDLGADITADEATKNRVARLEAEASKLRERNAKLESGLAAAKAAALTLAAHGQNVGAVLNRALGE
jgi:hypothetical protein